MREIVEEIQEIDWRDNLELEKQSSDRKEHLVRRSVGHFSTCGSSQKDNS
jgi:hypothetical protein